MDALLLTDEAFWDHVTGPLHPERPERLEALVAGVLASTASIERVAPRAATLDELALVHDRPHIDRIQRFCAAGGGALDADTVAGEASWTAALLAAGSGLAAIAAMEQGNAGLAVCVVRPPGHHARSDRAMGFCLFNNAAVTAAALAAEGQRVAIVDWDVHHGNGTQEIFAQSPQVLYVSVHEWGPAPGAPSISFYPGTGWLDEVGTGRGRGTTVNVPLPAASGGDAYGEAFESVVVPVLENFGADWLIVSAGYDAHVGDPLGHMGLEAADFLGMAHHLAGMGPTLVMTEGGYDLEALQACMAATVDGLLGVDPARSPLTTRSPDAAFRLIEQTRIAAQASGALP